MPVRRLAAAVVVVVAAAALLGAAQLHGSTGASDAQTQGTLFVSPTGSDSGRCTSSAPCKSFNRAYHVAAAGSVVEVAGGTYPNQVLTEDPSKNGTAHVVFRPALKASVTTGELGFGVRGGETAASHVTIDGQGRWTSGEIGFYLLASDRFSSDVTIENLKLRPNAGIYIRGTDRTTLRNVQVGPVYDGNDGMNISPRDTEGFTRDVTNLLLDRVSVHDIVRFCAHLPSPQEGCFDQPEAHTDCIQWWSGVNVVIRNSRFYNCSTSTWLIQGEYGGHIANWTVENNMLGPTLDTSRNYITIAGGSGAGESAYVSGALRFRNNSISGPIKMSGAALDGSVTMTISNNIFEGGCPDRATYSRNLVADGRCGPNDLTGRADFVSANPLSTDLHLKAGSPGLGAGDPKDQPPTDIDGDQRPLRAPADIGADQRQTAAVTPGRGIGPARLKSTRSALEQVLGASKLRTVQGVPLKRASYGTRATQIDVYYRGDRVVGLATSALFYSLPGGLGVGVTAGTASGNQPRWASCWYAYKSPPGTATIAETRKNRQDGKISRVVMATEPLAASGWPLRCPAR